MKFGVIVFPGSNCDRDMQLALQDDLKQEVIMLWHPMMEQVIEFANRGGKVFGVCNGFQILCESGLLPGVLLQNDHQKFVCKNVFIKSTNTNNIIGDSVGPKILKIPVAHGEGRYHADAATMASLRENNQIVFRYCNEHGEVHLNSNPNGAADNIAGICNKNRNVYGMMPHPERACSDALNNIDGRQILKAFTHMN